MGDASAERAFITGGHGFVGRHLIALLENWGLDPVAPSKDKLDLCDDAAVMAALESAEPTVIYHLAAFSSPIQSADRPAEALLSNLSMTVNLLEAVRRRAPEATVVLVGSGQVYGTPDQMPVDEDTPLMPQNPYAVSKAACDMLGFQYAESHEMRVVRMRPFNHAGPGQSADYVIGSLARQVAEAEVSDAEECRLFTGNPNSARDFSDVRDVVRAYVSAAGVGGGVFNVCSGSAVSVSELVSIISSQARVPVRHEVDPSRLRAHDLPELFGSHERLTVACGWRPEIAIEETICDTLERWREALAQ